MANMLERIDYQIKLREEWLANVKKARDYIALLPKELQELDGEADVWGLGKDSYMTAEFSNIMNDKIDLLKTAKMIGVQGLKPEMLNPTSWRAEGEIMLPNGLKAKIILRALPAPPTCHIEEYQETVTKYRAICNETGAEVK